MKKFLIAILILVIIGIILLHVCPPFEAWLHQITGWY